MESFRAVIDRFGYANLAALLRVRAGTVSSWRTRNQIPPEFWVAVVQAAAIAREPRITLQLLAQLENERGNERKIRRAVVTSANRAIA